MLSSSSSKPPSSKNALVSNMLSLAHSSDSCRNRHACLTCANVSAIESNDPDCTQPTPLLPVGATGPYRTVLLNHHVLLFETLLETGQILPMHTHPKPHLRYTFSVATQKHTWKDGTTSIQEDKKGEFEWRDELEHAVENVGQDPIHSLVFEFNRPSEDPLGLFAAGNLVWSEEELRPICTSLKIPIDNHRLRVFEITLNQHHADHATQVPDSHPHPYVLPSAHGPTLFYAFDPWHANILVGPTTRLDIMVERGQALWFESGIRQIQNVGKFKSRILCISLKQGATSNGNGGGQRSKL